MEMLPLQREASVEILLNLVDILLITFRMKLWFSPCLPAEGASLIIFKISSSGRELMSVESEFDEGYSMIEIMDGLDLSLFGV